MTRHRRPHYDLQTIMGSERQRARVSVSNRTAHLGPERGENEERGRDLLQQLRRCRELKVLVHDVNIQQLSEPLRGELLAECARLGFDHINGVQA